MSSNTSRQQDLAIIWEESWKEGSEGMIFIGAIEFTYSIPIIKWPIGEVYVSTALIQVFL